MELKTSKQIYGLIHNHTFPFCNCSNIGNHALNVNTFNQTEWVTIDDILKYIEERGKLIGLQIADLEDGEEVGEGKHPHLIEYGSQRLNELKKLKEQLTAITSTTHGGKK